MKQGLRQKQKISLNLTANLGEQIKLLSLSGYEVSSKLNDLIKEYFQDEDDKKVSYFKDEFKTDFYKKILEKESSLLTERTERMVAIDLQQNLIDQFELLALNEIQFLIGQVIIDSVENNGRLDPDLEFDDIRKIVLEDFNTNVSDEEITKVLRLIQDLDPPGCAYRNIKESFTVQMDHLDLSKSQKTKLSISLDALLEKKINFEEIPRDIKKNLLKLSFSPGNEFGAYDEFYTRPDLVVIKNKKRWIVSLNDKFMSQELLDRVKEKIDISSNDNRHEAKSFLKGLERRQQTLLLVAEVIIEAQSEFLDGKAKKKFLSNKEIADLLNISPSTVSRIVRSKYIQLPDQQINLKSLLAKRVNKEKQEINITSEDLKIIIRELINTESKKNPLSDEKIKQAIAEKFNTQIARRTISKYRLELNIDSMRKRKLSD